LLALLNIRNVKNGVRFIEFTSLAKLIPLVILVIAGAGFVSTQNLHWVTRPGVGNIGAASLLLFFAFLGLEGPLSNGGEIKNPKRTVPLGVLLGIAAVLVLYMSIQLVTQGVLGNTMAAHKEAPLAAVAGIAFGKWGPAIVIAITAVAMLGALGGDILSIPRILFAGARDGLLPKPLAKIHTRYCTPHIAIAFYAALGFLLAISGGFKQLATIASAAVLITYLGVVLASVILQQKETGKAVKTFRVPGGMVVPALACAGIIWLLCSLTRAELTGIAVFIAVFSVIYLIMAQVKKRN
jgi:basic amino acid/polyamine antiporter, APA family